MSEFFFLICSQKREKMGIYQMRTQNSWIKPTVILQSSKVTMLAPMCLVWAPTPHSHTALTPTNQDADAAMTSSASHVMTFRHWACWVSGRNHLIWSVFFQIHFHDKKFLVLIKISMKFVHKGSIENNSKLVQVLPGCWLGNYSHLLKQWWPSCLRNYIKCKDIFMFCQKI